MFVHVPFLVFDCDHEVRDTWKPRQRDHKNNCLHYCSHQCPSSWPWQATSLDMAHASLAVAFGCWVYVLLNADETLLQFFEWSQVWLGSNLSVCLSMAIFNLPCPVIPGRTFLRVMQSIVFGKRNWREEGGRGMAHPISDSFSCLWT